MPLLTRWAIRLAMGYLVAGMLAGTLYWLHTSIGLWQPLIALRPVYIHMLVVGWLTQLIYGVIYWMFPIISRDNMRGDPRRAWTALIILNVGLLLRIVCEPWQILENNAFNQLGLIASAILQVIGSYLIVWVCWARVRPKPGK